MFNFNVRVLSENKQRETLSDIIPILCRSFARMQRIDTRMLEYNCTARRRHSPEWIQSGLRERVSFPNVSNFIVTRSIRYSFVLHKRAMSIVRPGFVNYAKNDRLLGLRDSSCGICRLKPILRSRTEIINTRNNAASSLIKPDVEGILNAESTINSHVSSKLFSIKFPIFFFSISLQVS